MPGSVDGRRGEILTGVGGTLGGEDRLLVDRLRAGDEASFERLVDELTPSLLRVARMYVRTAALAEEVVQETWLGVLKGLDRFEGRSSLRTWIFRILTNTAKTRAVRESRSIPLSSLDSPTAELDGESVDPDRFLSSGRWEGHWASALPRWSEQPEDQLLAQETVDVVRRAIDGLPPTQRAVISLRDVEGWRSEDVRNVLELSETNQRVLLHRARSKVRQALEEHFAT
jgi:RNA polymerase sigma-70 factor, ECF subfamily